MQIVSEQTSSSKPHERADAARNKAQVLEAAREVLSADSDAPMSQIVAAAGVGTGTVYRHYPSKEALVVALCLDAMDRVEVVAHDAVATTGSTPGAAFNKFMIDAFDAGTGAFVRLAGTFDPPPEIVAASLRMRDAMARLLKAAQRAGTVRADVTVADLQLILEQVRTVRVADSRRIPAFQHRYLALSLQGLQSTSGENLPGPTPTWEDDISQRWSR